jgi:hypothetical protein
MNRSTLRIGILIFGLFTAVVHLILLNIRMGGLDPAFTANGIGYLVLLGLFFFNPPFLAGRERLLHYVYMGFAAVTIVAYLVINQQRFTDVLGLVTKIDEILLILSLWQHLRLTQKTA